jgi:hypothetical protein
VIVFETSERPDWRQLSEHPLIRKQNEEVNQRFIQKVDVVVDPRLDEWDGVKNSLANSVAEIDDRRGEEKKSEEKTEERFKLQPKEKEKEEPPTDSPAKEREKEKTK